jgi:hypothetical protein
MSIQDLTYASGRVRLQLREVVSLFLLLQLALSGSSLWYAARSTAEASAVLGSFRYLDALYTLLLIHDGDDHLR